MCELGVMLLLLMLYPSEVAERSLPSGAVRARRGGRAAQGRAGLAGGFHRQTHSLQIPSAHCNSFEVHHVVCGAVHPCNHCFTLH